MMSTDNRGLSTVAIIIVAAVVIGGGAMIAFNSSNNAEVDTNPATTTSATSSSENSEALNVTLACAGDQTVDVSITGENEADVTLPDGEVKSVTRTETDSGATYTNAEGDFSISGMSDEAVIEQDGEVILDNCVVQEDAGSADAETESNQTESESEATSSAEVQTDVEADLEVNTETESETSTQ